MTKEDRLKAVEMLVYIGQFAGHKSDCSTNLSFSNPGSDYCNCDYALARRNNVELLTMLRQS